MTTKTGDQGDQIQTVGVFADNLLFETDVNPLPPGIRSATLTLADGKIMRYAISRTDANPALGTVLLLQGRNEYIEKYFETISDLNRRGFTVATFDWRGQGGSSRLIRDAMRGYVRRFDDFSTDLEQFVEDILVPQCPTPLYVLAHSAGALVALLSLPRLVTRISRMVLAAPLLGLEGQKLSDANVYRLTLTLRRLGLGRLYAANGPRTLEGRPFNDNPLTSDAARYKRNAEISRNHAQLALGGPTVRWVAAALDTIRRVHAPAYFEGLSMPILIMAAGADRVVSNRAITDFSTHLRNATLITIDGARHELLQETDFYREQFWAAFDAFIPGAGPQTDALKA